MSREWMDVSQIPFNSMLLLETFQLSLFPGWLPERELSVALRANPCVEWFLRHKCPQLNVWLDRVMSGTREPGRGSPAEVRKAEVAVLEHVTDMLVYATDPGIYDAQPFLGWDSRELTSLVDFSGTLVIDVGAGTGRLALVAAEHATAVFAVEPASNLRTYLKRKARDQGRRNIHVVDGLITDLPFPDHFAHVTMGGHVFGDEPEAEYEELRRVTRGGGMLILCPGNVDQDNQVHRFLLAQRFDWSRFEEPRDGTKRKYWRKI